MATTYGRYLTPAEAKSGKYAGMTITIPGSGVRFKSPQIQQQALSGKTQSTSGGLGRYLTPAEAKSGKYAGMTVVIPGSGIRFKTTANEKGPANGGKPAGIGEPYDTILGQMKGLLDELQKKGQTVNPNIEITPEKVTEFMKQAESEINPYYTTQLKLAREGFLSSLGYDATAIQQNEADLTRKYTDAFKGIGASAAEAGFAQSGQRQQAEENLTRDVNNQILQNRQALGQREGDLARAFGQTYGGGELKATASPNLSAMPVVSGGTVTTQGGGQPLYQLSPSIYDKLVGTNEFQRRAAIQSRVSELESAFRTGQSINQLKGLTI